MGIGRSLVVLGVVLILVGALFMVGEKLPIRLGRLPGDIAYHGKNTTFYFPWVTCLLISIIVSVLFWLFGRR